jgi:hypothetical protein
MSTDPKHPDIGDLIIDASQLPVRDLTPEQIKKITKLRDGALPALQRILQLTPQELVAAGISAAEITRANTLLSEYKYADELLPPAEKLAELMHETKLDRGHQIANLLTEIAGQVRRRAERDLLDDEILAKLEEVFDYQYGPAYMAQLTRARKAEAEAEPPASELPPTQPPSQTL